MTERRTDRMRRRGHALVLGALVLGALVCLPSAPASAAACSMSTGATTCSVNTSTQVSGGTLTLLHPASLFWGFVASGYDQWSSGSATALTGCTSSGSATSCTGGTAPRLEVMDATGSGNGWSVSGYVTSSTLPTGSTLTFNGAGSGTIGTTTASTANPFVATAPTSVCDYGSSCTTATAATSCTHSSLGFTSCPSYGVNLLAGTAANAQVDLYSAAASSGLGAICFGSGSSTAAGCAGSSPGAFYNLGMRSNAAAGSYAATLNLTVSSGP